VFEEYRQDPDKSSTLFRGLSREKVAPFGAAKATIYAIKYLGRFEG
jgi:hypothetical protein